MEPEMTPGPQSDARRSIPAWADFFAEGLAQLPLIVILRGLSPGAAVAAATTAWDAGVRLLEVTVERDEGYAGLEAVLAAASEHHLVGAGTLTTPDHLNRAADMGARFGVAPGLDLDTVQAAADRGLPFLPGVATATEAGQALRFGVSTVKAFPAQTLGPEWVSALAGPYPTLRVIPTGGVGPNSAAEFLRAGAIGVGVGSSITSGDGLDQLLAALRTA